MAKLLIFLVTGLIFVISGCEKNPSGSWSKMSQEAYDYNNKTNRVQDDKQVNMSSDNQNEKSRDVQNTLPTVDEQPEKVVKTDSKWKQELDPIEYRVLREKATERAFTGKYWNHYEVGTYYCAGCGQELFDSDAKFKSGCGWPSYFKPAADGVILEKVDRSHGMVRTEVICSKCGGHLGHVFNDGPNPTGLRYCINSAAIHFGKKDEIAEKQSDK